MSRASARKPGVYSNEAGRRSYRRVLMAVYWLADPFIILCAATNAEIAREAGLSVETTKRYLHDMEKEGIIATFDPEPGVPRRAIILLDNAGGSSLFESLMSSGRRPGLHTSEGPAVANFEPIDAGTF